MPVASRGKLDRKRLPPPPADLGMGEGDFVPCESRTEKVIEAVWQELLGYDDTPSLGDFIAVVAVAVVWVARVAQCETFFVLTVLAKKVFVGSPSRAAPADTADCFRRWLLDRLVHHPFFCGATEPYVNTELLSAKFRMLGAKIGS
ncbi:hypothetical protein JL720_15971 [Aureococcus anophagefferens]|nr:hypothetical protein JL720_15971 [Aureococcus anophagefferens]